LGSSSVVAISRTVPHIVFEEPGTIEVFAVNKGGDSLSDQYIKMFVKKTFTTPGSFVAGGFNPVTLERHMQNVHLDTFSEFATRN
jgi:hypothetical protein